MGKIVFPFEEQKTEIFGLIRRPTADVFFWSKKLTNWIPIKMVVDTGADYTLLPSWLAEKLGISLTGDCRRFVTYGVGGRQNVYLVKNGWRVKLENWGKTITVGFLGDDNIPPLLGRLHFSEDLKVTFFNFKTEFEFS